MTKSTTTREHISISSLIFDWHLATETVFRSHWWTSPDINPKSQCCIRSISQLGHVQSNLHLMLVQYSGTSRGFPSRFLGWDIVYTYTLLAFGKLKLVRANIFLSCTTSRPALRAHPDFYLKGTVVLFPGVKRSGHEDNHSPLTSSEVKNGWSSISTPCICLHGVDRKKLPLS